VRHGILLCAPEARDGGESAPLAGDTVGAVARDATMSPPRRRRAASRAKRRGRVGDSAVIGAARTPTTGVGAGPDRPRRGHHPRASEARARASAAVEPVRCARDALADMERRVGARRGSSSSTPAAGRHRAHDRGDGVSVALGHDGSDDPHALRGPGVARAVRDLFLRLLGVVF
jgi:hypothetical protein